MKTLSMKKLLLLMLALLVVVAACTACGEKDPQGGSDTPEIQSPQGELSAIIEDIYAIQDAGLNVVTTTVDLTDANALKSFTGLDSADKISEVAVSEPMISSQAYSLVLVRVSDSADAEEIAQAMKDGIDPRKWICVEADDLRVVGYGDLLMLVMMDSQLADTITSEQMVAAFAEVCGGDLTIDLQ